MRQNSRVLGITLAAVIVLFWDVSPAYGRKGNPTAPPAATGADRPLFLGVVQRLQAGERYYSAMAAELHARGFPSGSVWNWRTPPYLWLLARASVPGATVLFILIALLGLSWLLPPLSPPKLLIVAGPLLGMAGVIYFAEAWAGALIAVSLGAYRQKRWILAALFGVLAVFFRELAAVYALGCGLLAFRARRRGESVVWILGGLLYIAFFVWHTQMVYASTPSGARLHPHSWVQWGGVAFLASTLKWYVWVAVAPSILGPLMLVIGSFGVASKQMPSQARIALLVYSLTFMVIGHPFNTYWGLVTVPLWSLALVSARDGWDRVWCVGVRQTCAELTRTGPSLR